MYLLFLLILNVSLAISDTNIGTEYCDINSKSCEIADVSKENEKYIFYEVNPGEGFNLSRDVYMRFAIMLSEAWKKGKKEWKLVLPPWYDLYHWDWDRGLPQPWQKFFDIDSLKSFAPVVELHEVFSKMNSKALEIDVLYILQNYEDAFEEGVFKDKWQILRKCNDKALYWGYKNITAKEVLCVKFQGKVSKLWELIPMHPNDKKVMFAHGEIPLHDSYGTKPFWDCRKSMKFNKNLITTAKKYISTYLNCNKLKCDNYLSIHWRRQDFARGRGNEVPTIAGTLKQIRKTLKKLKNIKKVFIASDASMGELSQLRKELTDWKYEVHVFLADPELIKQHGDGGIAIIDQIICSRSAYFIGTHESTFTYRIQEEREIMGFDSDTTFNRFCPDTGPCEKASRWTVIN